MKKPPSPLNYFKIDSVRNKNSKKPKKAEKNPRKKLTN